MSKPNDLIQKHHERVVRLHKAGSSLSEIAEALAPLGVKVSRSAVDRYLKSRGISRDAAAEGVSEPPPAQPKQDLPDLPVSPTPLVIPPASSVTIASPEFPVATPLIHSLVPRQDTISPLSDEYRIAHILVKLGEFTRRIDDARTAQDARSLRRVLIEARDWLSRHETEAPETARPMVHRAFEQVVVMLELSPETLLRKPLFAPLPPGTWVPSLDLLRFGEHVEWTLQDSFEGTLILGATGSGKTSGSGSLLARSFLNTHYGGLVLTVKDDERGLWERYAKDTGRTEQLCVIKPGGPFAFNFLDYQSRLSDDQGGSTENIVELLYAILEAYGRGKRDQNTFWRNSAKQLLRNFVRVMRAADEPLDIRTLRGFITQAPASARDAETGAWRQSSTFGRVLLAAESLSKGTPHEEVIREAMTYWTWEFPRLAAETRSVIVTELSSTVDLFAEPTLRELFCGETTIVPEAIFDGAVIVVDLPIKRMLSVGRIAQIIWKHFVQLAIERRPTSGGDSRRPVFLWADEAQEFVADYDAAFQATARSSRCATVYLSQNLPGFYTAIGSEQPRERVNALVANLCTKIFHANNDPTTNQWAADQIGRDWQPRVSVSSQPPPENRSFLSRLMGSSKTSSSVSQSLDHLLQPSDFTKLRSGGERHGRLVDAWFVKSGGRFADGRNFFKASFQQE